MRALGWVTCAAVLLAGCAPRSESEAPVYRDAGRPIYSTASFDLRQLDGIWQQRGTVGSSDCSPGGLDLQVLGADEITGSWILCLGERRRAGQGAVTPIGPGRFTLPELDVPVWVLWIDADARTMVLGTPSGSFAVVLDRKAEIPADRKAAVRDILAWNGYDIARLQFWPQ